MTRALGRLALALPLAVAAPLAAPRGEAGATPHSAAQPSVTVQGPSGADVIGTITPTFVVRASGFAAGATPELRLQVASDADFATLLMDSALVADSALITMPAPLAEGTVLHWRAIARGTAGDSAMSAVVGPRAVPPWVRLVFPNEPSGATLSTRRPTFVWSGAQLDSSVGPWSYTLELFASNGGQPIHVSPPLGDTTWTPTRDLESNTSYRWTVEARLPSGERARVQSIASFVIVDPTRPIATLLFQNFPNPFPGSTADRTCIWFDLRADGDVRLDVYDLRGRSVRTLVPSNEVSGYLPAGRYGRGAPGGSPAGCDPRFTWDGTARDGRIVPAGVYLLRFTADGTTQTRKMVFRGR